MSSSIAIVGLIGSLITIITLILSFIRFRKRRGNAIKRNIGSLGSDAYETIHKDNYIPTLGQVDNPFEVIESKNEYSKVTNFEQFPLSQKILQEIQNEEKGVNKLRFFILGETGMGKTLSLAYFVEKYYGQNFFFFPPYHVYTVYLGSPNCLKDIDRIERNDSILILDALDENASAIKNIKDFTKKLESVTDRFRFVIISSRTQFFKDKANIPEISTIIQNGAGNNLLYRIYYISPFTEKEINAYLGKKFGDYTDKYLRAKDIVDKCTALMVRPMVLNFIDILLKFDTYRHINSSEIYQAIIDKWFEREIIICGNKFNISIEDLYLFSKNFALFVYDKWINFSRAEVTKEEYNSFVKSNGYKESPYSFKERSLLSRRDDGSVKFSHRSFWEFFMALYAIENPGVSLCANGMDAAISFYKEIIQMFHVNLKLHCVKPYIPHVLNGVDKIIHDLEIHEKVFVALHEKADELIYEEVMDAFYCLWKTIVQILLYKRFHFLKKNIDNLNVTGFHTDSLKELQAVQINNHLEKTSSLYEEVVYPMFKNCFAVLCSLKKKQRNLIGIVSKVLELLQDTIVRIKDEEIGEKNNPLMYPSSNIIIRNFGGALDSIARFDYIFKGSLSFFKEKKESLIFPGSTYFKLYRDKFSAKNNTMDDCIIVGSGFNDDNNIVSFLNNLFSKDYVDGTEVVCIYKKIKKIEEAVNFVKYLNNGTSTEKDIISIFEINDLIFYYVTNTFTRFYSEEIKRVFDNMMIIEKRKKSQ